MDASYKNSLRQQRYAKTDKNQVDMIFASNNESNEHNFLCFIRRITSECFLHECLNNFTSLTIRSCIHAGCRLHRFAFLFFQCKKNVFCTFFYCLKSFFFHHQNLMAWATGRYSWLTFSNDIFYLYKKWRERKKTYKKQRTIFCFVDVFGPRYPYFCLYILNVNKI